MDGCPAMPIAPPSTPAPEMGFPPYGWALSRQDPVIWFFNSLKLPVSLSSRWKIPKIGVCGRFGLSKKLLAPCLDGIRPLWVLFYFVPRENVNLTAKLTMYGWHLTPLSPFSISCPWKTWTKLAMYGWRILPSPLDEAELSVTNVCFLRSRWVGILRICKCAKYRFASVPWMFASWEVDG